MGVFVVVVILRRLVMRIVMVRIRLVGMMRMMMHVRHAVRRRVPRSGSVRRGLLLLLPRLRRRLRLFAIGKVVRDTRGRIA